MTTKNGKSAPNDVTKYKINPAHAFHVACS